MAARPYLETNRSTRTVNLLLLADAPVGPGRFNFDGASAGRMTVTVPVGWKVVVECSNYSTELSEGCAVVDAGTAIAPLGCGTTGPLRRVSAPGPEHPRRHPGPHRGVTQLAARRRRPAVGSWPAGWSSWAEEAAAAESPERAAATRSVSALSSAPTRLARPTR